MNEKEWFPEKFSEIEQSKFILRNAYRETTERTISIHFFYSNPFVDAFYLQMYCFDQEWNVIKSTLKRSNGTNKKDYILVEKGEVSSSTPFNQLLHLIKTTLPSIFPLNDNQLEWRDGEQVELSIENEINKTSFSWWLDLCPEDWSVLDKIAYKILEIEKNTVYKSKMKQHFDLIMEQTSQDLNSVQEKSLLLSYKRID